MFTRSLALAPTARSRAAFRSRTKAIVVAGLAAVATFGATAAPARADFTQTLTYQCDLPLVGSTPVSVVATTSIPANWPPNVPFPPFALSAAVTVKDTSWSAVLANAAGAATIEGSTSPNLKTGATYGALADAKVAYPGGPPAGLPVQVPLAIAPSHVDAASSATFTGKGSTPQLVFPANGVATITLGGLHLNLAVKKADGSPVVLPGTVYDGNGDSIDSDGDPNTFDVNCVGPTATTGPPISINVVIVEPTPTPTQTTTPPPTPTPTATPRVFCLAVVIPPPAPANVTASSITPLGATLTWGKSVPVDPNCDAPVTGYDIYNGSTKIASVSGANTTTTPIGGLTPSTTYTLSVRATTASSGTSAPSSVTFTTGTIDPPNNGFSVKGSATLKNLAKGALPLTGSMPIHLNTFSGLFTAQLNLNQTTGNLTALGFLPVVAKVNFVSTQDVTGQLKTGKLTATAKVRIKLPSITVFGAQIAGGSSCQATQVSTIPLASTQPTFDPFVGGPIAGSFSISNLAGCGALTGVISPLTAGGGNSILLNLTPTS